MTMLKPGYKQTDLGVLPEEWEAKSIGKLVKFEGGSQPPKTVFSAENKPEYMRLVQIRDYKTDNFATYVPANLVRKTCTRYDVMIGRYGPPVFQILRGIEGAYNVALIKTIPSTEINFEYWYYIVSQDSLFTYIDGLSRRSSGQTGVDMVALKDYLIPLPPPAEQQAIADTLGAVDALLREQRALLTKKRDLKQATQTALLTRTRRLPGFLGEWQQKTLGEVATGFCSGATPYRANKHYYDGNIKWVTSGELNYNIITDTIEHISPLAVKRTNLSILPKGTFLMAITGLEAAGTRGSCAILGTEATTNQSCMAIFTGQELLTDYLFHYYVNYGDELAFRYCQGTKQQSYTGKIVKVLPIYLPPVDEQRAIVSVLSNMSAEIESIAAQVAKTEALKQGLMQDLLTGTIRLNETAKSSTV